MCVLKIGEKFVWTSWILYNTPELHVLFINKYDNLLYTSKRIIVRDSNFTIQIILIIVNF